MRVLRGIVLGLFSLPIVALVLEARALPPSQGQGPPCSAAEYRALDFWIGTWTARNGQGVVTGHASIERVNDGCALLESWSSPPSAKAAFVGKAFHRFDALSAQWEQYWTDNRGSATLLKGELLPAGGVRYAWQTSTPSGATVFHRQTIAPDEKGGVVNSSDSSTDGGETWAASYAFVYTQSEGGG